MNTFFSSETSAFFALKEYGGGKVKRVGDAVFAGAVGALKLAMAMPMECWNDLRTPSAEPKTQVA